MCPRFESRGAQWLSGRVLDSRPKGRGFEPHRRHCLVSLSKTQLYLLSTGSTQEDPSRRNWKIVDWDIKNQIKHESIHFLLQKLIYSTCSKIVNSSCLPQKPRQTGQTQIRVFPVCFLRSILWVPAMITNILLENRKRKMFEILEHLPLFRKSQCFEMWF